MVARIKQLFTKISQMKAQRTELYSKLRDQVMADDITKNIVTRGSDDTKVRGCNCKQLYTDLV